MSTTSNTGNKPLPAKGVIFFGSSRFSAFVLEELLGTVAQPTVIVTTVDKPVGRKLILTPTQVAQIGEREGITVLKIEKFDEESCRTLTLTSHNIQVGILASFGAMVPQSILNLFPKHILNVHPSLLPKYRGASPIQTALINGDTQTGVTIMKLVREMDAGPIVAQQTLPISDCDTYATLEQKTARIGARQLIAVLPLWLSGTLHASEQDHASATFTRRFTKKDGEIDWSHSLWSIHNRIRAFSVWPIAHTMWNNTRLQIIETEYNGQKITDTSEVEASAVKIIAQNGYPVIQRNSESLLIKRLKLAGKQEKTGKEFLIAHPAFIDSNF